MRVTLLTSWNERCGIAAYARGLVAALEQRVAVEVVPVRFDRPAAAQWEGWAAALAAGDLAHLQHAYAFFGGFHPLRDRFTRLIRRVRRPVLLTVHEFDPGSGWRAPYHRWFNRRALLAPAVRRWIVHTEPLREALVGLGAPPDRIHVLPMPVPDPLPTPPREAVRDALGWRERIVLLIPGFLARRKGYDVALAGLAQLPRDYLLVAAGGEHAADRTGTAADLQALAARLGVADRFAITGYLSDEALAAHLVASDLVLAPFRAMTGSASLHLAIAYRKAIVASDLPPNRPLPCVERVPIGDADALAATIRRLIASPAERHALEQAADRFARDHGYRRLAEETVAIYRAILTEGD